MPGWDLVITLKESTAVKLRGFSSEQIGRKMLLVDGYGKEILIGGAVVKEPLPSPFVISGIQTEEDTIKARDRIISSSGACGVYEDKQ